MAFNGSPFNVLHINNTCVFLCNTLNGEPYNALQLIFTRNKYFSYV